MTTSTLHLNNPVPSNGAVVSSLGGRHTVTVTLAGVGAISCVVQAWGSEQGTDSRKIGAPVTVSGTTTVSQTLTFDADCKQFWLELVKLSPACKFNATVENDGSTSFAGPLEVAGGVVADGAPIRAAIDGPVTISTYGDSTDAWYNGLTTDANYASNHYYDKSTILAEIPATGTSTFQVNFAACPLLYMSGKFRFVGQGGVPGESTTAILARQNATAAINRKSLQDIASLRSRVAIVNGVSINDLQSLDVGDNEAAYATMISNCLQIIRYLSETHELVVWTGIFGFYNPAFTAARNAAILALVRRSQDDMQTLALGFANVVYIHPVGLTCDATGDWLPGMYGSGSVRLHLSQVGALTHGAAVKKILDARYDVRENSALVGDPVKDWFTPSGGEPTGVDTAAIGSATLGTRTTAAGVLTIPVTTTADADGAQTIFNNLEAWIAGGVAGDKYRVVFDYDVLDANGDRVPYHYVQADVRLNYTGGGTVDIQMPYCGSSSGQCSTPIFELDRDVSALSASCTAWLLIRPQHGAGTFTVKVYPPKVCKL